MVRVLFVCMGNICRSPTAEAVLRRLAADRGLDGRVEVRSAGTHAYHVGEGADPRSVRAARRRGYDLASHRARRVTAADFDEFDHVLAMDRDNLRQLEALGKGRDVRTRPVLFLRYAPTARYDEVPDPYALADDGFELVLDLVESASEGLLDEIAASVAPSRR